MDRRRVQKETARTRSCALQQGCERRESGVESKGGKKDKKRKKGRVREEFASANARPSTECTEGRRAGVDIGLAWPAVPGSQPSASRRPGQMQIELPLEGKRLGDRSSQARHHTGYSSGQGRETRVKSSELGGDRQKERTKRTKDRKERSIYRRHRARSRAKRAPRAHGTTPRKGAPFYAGATTRTRAQSSGSRSKEVVYKSDKSSSREDPSARLAACASAARTQVQRVRSLSYFPDFPFSLSYSSTHARMFLNSASFVHSFFSSSTTSPVSP